MEQYPLLVSLVQDEPHEVKAGQQGGRQRDVLCGRAPGVVAAVCRVRSSQEGGARVQCGGDACFGNAHRLLLHHLPQAPHVSAGLQAQACETQTEHPVEAFTDRQAPQGRLPPGLFLVGKKETLVRGEATMQVRTDLMDGCAVALLHLVEFVNAADTLVCQHQGSTLQHLQASALT